MSQLAARTPAESAQTARTAWRVRHHKNRARSCVTLLLRRKRLNEPLQVRRLLPRRDQRQAIVHHYYQIVNAVNDDASGIRVNDVVTAIQKVDVAAGHVAELVLIACAAERIPRPDIIPAEFPRNDRYVLAALQHARVDRNRIVDPIEELRRLPVRGERERSFQFARVLLDLRQKVADGPDKDS